MYTPLTSSLFLSLNYSQCVNQWLLWSKVWVQITHVSVRTMWRTCLSNDKETTVTILIYIQRLLFPWWSRSEWHLESPYRESLTWGIWTHPFPLRLHPSVEVGDSLLFVDGRLGTVSEVLYYHRCLVPYIVPENEDVIHQLCWVTNSHRCPWPTPITRV